MSETEAQTTKKRTKKDDYIVQGSILAAAAVLTKIIGVVYRIPLTNILGDEGNGFHHSAFRLPYPSWYRSDLQSVRNEMHSMYLSVHLLLQSVLDYSSR